ncbi:MAG: hypothetical protein EA392_13520 [Cryomorphaceae bacterium]|nr:MAG: hypothetical protein EA392_13520 [Cryomorphaceae bacterium]
MRANHLLHRIYPYVLTVLFALSAGLYGAAFYPMLTADHAIHVMMAKQFDVSHSLYYWGQDRLGSLLPGLTWPLAQVVHPLYAITLVQMLVLFGAWYCWSRWLQHKHHRLLLALSLWFPPLVFDPLVAIGQPYALMLLLWGVAFLLQRRANGCLWRTAASFFVLGLAVYVSEAGLLAIPLMLWWLSAKLRIDKKKPFVPALLKHLGIALAASVPVVLLILAAKKNSTRIPIYGAKPLNTPIEALGFAQQLWNEFADQWAESVVWATPYGWAQAMALLLLLSVPLSLLLWRRLSGGELREVLLLFALFGGYLGTVLMANWPASVPYSERFFSPLYFLGPLYLLRLTEGLRVAAFRFAASALIGLMCLIFSLRSAILILGPPPVFDDRLSAHDARNFPIEQGATYIGDYWNVYLLGAFFPHGVQYVPHDDDYVRHREFLHSAFQGEAIYLIANHWMEDFPEQVLQHGYYLQRMGDPQDHRGYRFCEYRQAD